MSRLFRGGVPTGPDVEKLMALGVSPGDRVLYDDVERLLGLKRASNRWHSVTIAWRKRLFREQHIQTEADGEAFVILTADQAVSSAIKHMTGIGRAAGRVVVRVETIDQAALSPRALDQHVLVRRHAAAVLVSTRDACKAVAPPRPVSGQPLRLAK